MTIKGDWKISNRDLKIAKVLKISRFPLRLTFGYCLAWRRGLLGYCKASCDQNEMTRLLNRWRQSVDDEIKSEVFASEPLKSLRNVFSFIEHSSARVKATRKDNARRLHECSCHVQHCTSFSSIKLALTWGDGEHKAIGVLSDQYFVVRIRHGFVHHQIFEVSITSDR